MPDISPKSTKLVALYARVSTARQEEEQTVQNQLLAMRDHCKERGYTIVAEYVDEGWSGDVLARPELDKLRQDASSNAWEAVLTYDPDRLARRYSYQALVTEELEEKGIELLYITVDTPKNSEDKIFHGMRGLFAEYERAKIAERFRLGKMRKLSEGHVLLSEPPYGYNYIPKSDGQHGYLEVNPTEAVVVKRIFTWIADDRIAIREVIRKLQAEGIRPRKSKRGVWATSTLGSLLRNEVYIGKAVWGSSEAVVPVRPIKAQKYKKIKKTSRRARPEEDWKYVEVPAILDKALFDRVQAQLVVNKSLYKGKKKYEYLLSGLVYCACGRRRYGEPVQRGKHLYYRCMDRVLSFPLPRTCHEKSLNVRKVDQAVWNALVDLMTSPDLLKAQVARFMNEQQITSQSSLNERAPIEKEIKRLKAEEMRYNKAYGAGVFSLETLTAYTAPLRQRLTALERELGKMQQAAAEAVSTEPPSEQAVDAFAAQAVATLSDLSFDKRREIVQRAITKVVGTPTHVHMYGIIPLDSYYDKQKTLHRYGADVARHAMPTASRQMIPFECYINLEP